MPTIVHFDVAADVPERARAFYESLFGWQMFSPPGMGEFHLIQTTDLIGQPGVGGGLGRRGEPSQRITVYFGVEDIDVCCEKISALGGQVTLPRTPVPGFGYLANCIDTEGNPFGLWQEDPTVGLST